MSLNFKTTSIIYDISLSYCELILRSCTITIGFDKLGAGVFENPDVINSQFCAYRALQLTQGSNVSSIKLEVNGAISFASPNAKSAFSRMGWSSELEGCNLGEVAEKVVTASPNAHEEGIRTRLNGKTLRRVEIDNQGATIDLLVLPLIQGTDRIGSIVLLQNVTELRRRDRELVTKDATLLVSVGMKQWFHQIQP